MKKLVPPLKWHGGKHYLAPKIVPLMPHHLHYVEPYAGGLSVLLHKNPEGVSEVVNDINWGLTNFWEVLREVKLFARFRRQVEAIPFSEPVWEAAAKDLTNKDPVRRAVAFFVRCRQSLAGRMDSFASISRSRTRGGLNEQASAWLSAVRGLEDVHARLSRVVIRNRNALDLIRSEDTINTLFYLDPPYLPSTRESRETYQFEMTEDDHRDLLAVVTTVKGKVMLSGYPSDLYDEALVGWEKHTFELPNNAASGSNKRRMTECLWCNFSPEE
ncbi:MAG: DNA adenine methylase [Gemmataceae bacterium]